MILISYTPVHMHLKSMSILAVQLIHSVVLAPGCHLPVCCHRGVSSHAHPDVYALLPHPQALLSIIVALTDSGQQDKLSQFLSARPEATSISFLTWLQRQGAAARNRGTRQKLDSICEKLVVFREVSEQDQLEAVYAATLDALTDGSSNQEEHVALMTRDPAAYSRALATSLTGHAPDPQDYMEEQPMYGLLLAAAPPAALTPEGIKQAHQQVRLHRQ